MIRRPPRSTLSSSSAASDVYKRQIEEKVNELSGMAEVFGKLTGHVPREGELTVDAVLKAFGQVICRFVTTNVPAELIAAERTLPLRPPVLCTGCPHRATFFALKKVFKKSAIYVCLLYTSDAAD